MRAYVFSLTTIIKLQTEYYDFLEKANFTEIPTG